MAPAGVRNRKGLRQRLRVFLPVAVIPNVVIVAVVVLLALCALILTNSGFVPLAATVAQLWLAVNLAPVASDSVILSQLPMLPALGVIWLVAHRVRAAVRHRMSVADLAVLTGCVIIVPMLLTATAVVMLVDARPVLPVEVPPLIPVLGRVLVLHLSALAIGMGPKLWHALARKFGVPPLVTDPVVPAIRFLLALAAAGLLLVLVCAFAHLHVLNDLFATFGRTSATFGLLVVSLLYLPDAAVAGAGVLVGSEFHLGDASVSLYGANVVPLPPLPILAAFPSGMDGWALLLIIIPLVLAGVIASRYCGAKLRTWPEMAVAGLWAGFFTLIVGWMSGGVVGVYGASGVMLIFTAVLVSIEFAAVGLVVLAVTGLLDRRAGSPGTPEDEVAVEPRKSEDSTSGQSGTINPDDGDAEQWRATESPESADVEDLVAAGEEVSEDSPRDEDESQVEESSTPDDVSDDDDTPTS
ncbi:DUF6350 family protein [Corynebacterium sp. CCM 9204]|uniref:cell division protein PerM n=1 Tax=Corynebacterium sp. CCM 9204 TaxID=3057616 RepID=UPI003525F109